MSSINTCYLCHSANLTKRPGSVRDNADLEVVECDNCGLVFISSFAHICDDFYKESCMHDESSLDITRWQQETAEDDKRRFDYTERLIRGNSVLDFGCGLGGYLLLARNSAKMAEGIELERRLAPHYKTNQLIVYPSLNELKGKKYDVITLFHVLEHIPDPSKLLIELATHLETGGRILIEVPNADDALLTLYRSTPFSNFHYWSCHLFLFNTSTLRELAKQSGLRTEYVRQIQRYPLSNHLHWLANGKPGGHKQWHFLDSPNLQTEYENALAKIGACDTLIASLTL